MSGTTTPCMTSRRMAFSADGVLMEIAMPNIQGNSAIHLVEKGGANIHHLININNSFLLTIHLEETLRTS